MLGCHDGIPLLNLKGILPETDIRNLIVARGGLVKNLHGQKNMYYQVNATYFSALGESENKQQVDNRNLYSPVSSDFCQILQKWLKTEKDSAIIYNNVCGCTH